MSLKRLIYIPDEDVDTIKALDAYWAAKRLSFSAGVVDLLKREAESSKVGIRLIQKAVAEPETAAGRMGKLIVKRHGGKLPPKRGKE